MFLAALWKQVFINRIDKEDVASVYVNTHTHTHNGILLSHKKG